jgi:uncharacterized protein (DUF1015 family)
MADIQPFSALRPPKDLAGRVIAPPYDVLSDAEARAIAHDEKSFVHVTRAEVDLPTGTDPHGPETYARAKTNLQAFIAKGWLIRDEQPRYYLYGQQMGSHRQTALLAACSVEEYDRGVIKKHEHTRPDKEDDRTEHMRVLDAQVGLVFLTYRSRTDVNALVQSVVTATPEWETTTEDNVVHRFWVVPDNVTSRLRAALGNVPTMYIADGHHRSAAASRFCAQSRTPPSRYFLAGLIPDSELHVLAYNRVVQDLHGTTPQQFLSKVMERFDVVAEEAEVPSCAGHVTMYLDKKWRTLAVKSDRATQQDPVAHLDVSVLQTHLLEPLLGIDDPRTSNRIQFVGGIRGPSALKNLVDKNGGVAFHLFPVPLDQLFAVSDAGRVMPPKSTWFEPKLREGVVARTLDRL